MKTPWHIWVVGLVTLLWHAGGAYGYLSAKLQPEAYLLAVPEDLRTPLAAYMAAMPIWATATWALGVWGAVLGSLLILFRSRLAVPAFAVALFGLIATSAYTYLLAPSSPMGAAPSLFFTTLIVLVLVFALVYARRQVAAGHLR